MAYGDDGNDFAFLIGGDSSVDPNYEPAMALVPGNRDGKISKFSSAHQRKGVFANYPAMTPKYTNTNDDRALETMARLIIPMPTTRARNQFVASIGRSCGADAKRLAEALASIGGDAVGKQGGQQYGLGYIDFLLTTATEAYQEKVQVVDVLSDNYVAYYFGSTPPVFQYAGVLMNTKQDDWRSAFTIIYNDIIRGTMLARRRAVVTLSYDNMAVTGTLMGMSQNFSADGPFYQLAASFNFSLLVQRIDLERISGSSPTPVATFPSFIKPGAFATQQFETPPKTIRNTGVPSSQTVERKKTVSDDEGPLEGDISPPTADVYGAPQSPTDNVVDGINSVLKGGQSIPEPV